MELEDYILSHSDKEPDYLAEINRKTHLKTINPRMLSGHLQGRVLAMLSKMIQPDAILEIGTFTGYSALCLAEGLSAKGQLHTIEKNDELEDFILENLKQSPYNEKIKLHIGDAKDKILDLDCKFDLIFLDADKKEYPDYYELVLSKLKIGGYLLVDNTLWNDKVLSEEVNKKDKQTQSIMSFNKALMADNRIEKVILPIRDGLTIIRKK